MKRQRAPYGSWSSPLDAARVANGGMRIYQPRRSGDRVTWLEVRPAEGGRTVLMQEHHGRRTELTPPPYGARSRAHEYGGGGYCFAGLDTWFVNDADQAVWHRDRDGAIRRLTPADERRYADLVRDPVRPRLLAVCEDHAAGAEPENSVVAIDDDGRITTLLSGNDFYASLRIDRQGQTARVADLESSEPALGRDGAVGRGVRRGRATDPPRAGGGRRAHLRVPARVAERRAGRLRRRPGRLVEPLRLAGERRSRASHGDGLRGRLATVGLRAVHLGRDPGRHPRRDDARRQLGAVAVRPWRRGAAVLGTRRDRASLHRRPGGRRAGGQPGPGHGGLHHGRTELPPAPARRLRAPAAGRGMDFAAGAARVPDRGRLEGLSPTTTRRPTRCTRARRTRRRP
jgi:hypothetical protein